MRDRIRGMSKEIDMETKDTHHRTLDTLTIWADANRRVLGALIELSAAGASESLRLYGELQQNTLEAFRDAQATSFPWPGSRLLEGNAEAVTRAAERLQASAEQAARGIQETFGMTGAKLKDLFAASH
jgi:hypothetical protein